MSFAEITAFLAPLEQVDACLRDTPDFRTFLALAQKSSGEPPPSSQLLGARFRITDARFSPLQEFALDDRIKVGGAATSIRELTHACAQIDRRQFIHSLWRLETFEALKAWLQAARALVRFTNGVDGGLQGQMLLCESIIPLVETVERRNYVLSNGDMASDAITRSYGMRAKVFALDRARRLPRKPEGEALMDRLSRTLSRLHR